jgi:Bacterial Ig-like domain
MRVAITLGLALSLWSCKPSGSVQCDDNAMCNRATGGVCLENPETGNQWCTYPELECPSGFRWSDLDVGDDVSGLCVALNATDFTPPVVVSRTPSPDEQAASPSTVISVTFSEKIDAASVTSESIQVQLDGGGAVPAQTLANGDSVVIATATPLDPRRTYKIFISTDVRDLAGNKLAEPVSWAFRTRDPSWKGQTLLEREQGKSVYDVHADAANGLVVAVWTFSSCTDSQHCDLPKEIWAAVQKNGVWLAAVPIGVSTYFASSPRVAVDGLGRAVAIWGQRDTGSGTHLMTSSYDGTVWSQADFLERMDQGDVQLQAITSDRAGSFFATWERVESVAGQVQLHVRAARYTANVGWSSPKRIDNLEPAASYPAVVSTAPGEAIVVWRQDGKIRLASYRAGAWSGPSDGPTANPSCITLAARNSEVTAVWKAGGGVYASRYQNDTWELPSTLHPTNGAVASCVNHQDTYYLSDGTLITAWTTGTNVLQATRVLGSNWGLSLPILSGNAFASNVRLAASGSRAFGMFYSSELLSNEYSPSLGWRGAERVLPDGVVNLNYSVVYDSGSNTFLMIFRHSKPGEVTSVSAKTYQ